jgi:hypothetical protein
MERMVSVATGYGLDGKVQFSVSARYVSLLHDVRAGCGPIQLPQRWSTGSLSEATKQPEH